MRTSIVFVLMLAFLTVEAGENKWTSAGPFGGFMFPFTFHPKDDNLIFSRASGSSYRSLNSGRTWQILPVQGSLIVRIHPKTPETILGLNYATWASTDRGASWQRLGNFPGRNATDFEFDPKDPNVLFAMSENQGVWKSTDGGRSWIEKNRGLKFTDEQHCCSQLEIDPTNGNILYALTTSKKVFKSTNGGENWKSSSNGLRILDVETLTIDPRDPKILFSGGHGSGIFKSTNSGNSWKAVDCPTCISVRQVYIDPHDHRVVYAAANFISKSTDSGNTWQPLPTPPNLDFFSVGSHPRKSNLILIGGFGAGIFRSIDSGKQWSEVNNKVLDVIAQDIEGHPSQPDRLFLAGTLPYQSFDEGKKWTRTKNIFSHALNSVKIHPRNPNLVVFSSIDVVIVSTDGGATYQNHNPTEFFSPGGFRGRQRLQLHPLDQNVMFVTPFDQANQSLGIAKTTDQGETWKFMNSGLSDKEVNAITIDSDRGSILFAGTQSGKIFKSTNGGKSWKDSSNGLNGNPVTSIEITPTNNKIVYCTTINGVFKSTNGGRNWIRKSNGLPGGDVLFGPDISLFYLVVSPANSNILYCGGSPPVLFISTDGANSWSAFDTNGLPPAGSQDLFINPATPETLDLGTGQGVFSFTRVASTNGPIVQQISPSTARVGDPVTMNGEHFGTSQGDSKISFPGAVAGNATSWTDGKITVPVPPGARTGSVTVTVATRKSNPFEFIVLPSSGNIEPVSGPSRGGTRVAILAPEEFPAGSFNVVFGSSLATEIGFIPPNIILCTSPPGTGTVDVSITTVALTFNAGSFTYE